METVHSMAAGCVETVHSMAAGCVETVHSMVAGISQTSDCRRSLASDGCSLWGDAKRWSRMRGDMEHVLTDSRFGLWDSRVPARQGGRTGADISVGS